MNSDLGVALAALGAATFVGVGALGAGAMARNHGEDSMIKWRKSMGTLFMFGNGPTGARIQAWILWAITMALFITSLVYAYRGLLLH